MNANNVLQQKSIEYADKQVDHNVDPLTHSMIKAAVSFGWSLHSDYVYKTKFNARQSLEDYVGGNIPEDML